MFYCFFIINQKRLWIMVAPLKYGYKVSIGFLNSGNSRILVGCFIWKFPEMNILLIRILGKSADLTKEIRQHQKLLTMISWQRFIMLYIVSQLWKDYESLRGWILTEYKTNYHLFISTPKEKTELCRTKYFSIVSA